MELFLRWIFIDDENRFNDEVIAKIFPSYTLDSFKKMIKKIGFKRYESEDNKTVFYSHHFFGKGDVEFLTSQVFDPNYEQNQLQMTFERNFVEIVEIVFLFMSCFPFQNLKSSRATNSKRIMIVIPITFHFDNLDDDDKDLIVGLNNMEALPLQSEEQLYYSEGTAYMVSNILWIINSLYSSTKLIILNFF